MNDLEQAKQLREQGDLAGAAEFCRRALADQPDTAVSIQLGDILSQLGQFEEARDAYAVAAADGAPEAQFKLGNVCGRFGDFEQARTCFRQVAEAMPHFGPAFFNLGNSCFAMDEFEEALEAYQQAAKIDDKNAHVFNNLGTAAAALRRLEPAIAAFQHAIELDHQFVPAFCNLARALMFGGMFTTAEWPAQRAHELAPDSLAYRLLVKILLHLDRVEDAAELLRDVVKQRPDDAVARHMLASCTGDQEITRAEDGFIREFFDDYSSTYDEHQASLECQAPQKVIEFLEPYLQDRKLDILDVGCGTGNGGVLLQPFARRLIGVDLSPGMLAKCAARGVYEDLVVAELTSYLRDSSEQFDLIYAVETLVYVGDLHEFCRESSRRLRPNGLLVFTTEHHEDAGEVPYRLNATGNFSHSAEHLHAATVAADLQVESVSPLVLRLERNQPVDGRLMVARYLGAAG